jgi:hypothetical protein
MSPISEYPVIDFPEPDSPTNPSTSPRPTAERNVVDRLDDTGLGEEMRAQALDLETGSLMRFGRRQSLLKSRIQHVAELIGDEVDADDRQQQCRCPERS